MDPSVLPAVRRAALDALEVLPADVLAPLHEKINEGRRNARTGAAPATAATAAKSASEWLVAWIDQADESGAATRPARETPASPDDVRRALAACGADEPLAVLHRLIQRARTVEAASPAQATAWRSIRGMVHQMLAKRETRVALYDLRETLEQAPEHLTVSMIAAVTALGDATCLEPIAAAWEKTSDAWLKGQLQDAFRVIVTREGLTRRHAAVKRLAARHPDLVDGVSMPSQTRPSRRLDHRT
jgi:hypothetical protein